MAISIILFTILAISSHKRCIRSSLERKNSKGGENTPVAPQQLWVRFRQPPHSPQEALPDSCDEHKELAKASGLYYQCGPFQGQYSWRKCSGTHGICFSRRLKRWVLHPAGVTDTDGFVAVSRNQVMETEGWIIKDNNSSDLLLNVLPVKRPIRDEVFERYQSDVLDAVAWEGAKCMERVETNHSQLSPEYVWLTNAMVFQLLGETLNMRRPPCTPASQMPMSLTPPYLMPGDALQVKEGEHEGEKCLLIETLNFMFETPAEKEQNKNAKVGALVALVPEFDHIASFEKSDSKLWSLREDRDTLQTHLVPDDMKPQLDYDKSDQYSYPRVAVPYDNLKVFDLDEFGGQLLIQSNLESDVPLKESSLRKWFESWETYATSFPHSFLLSRQMESKTTKRGDLNWPQILQDVRNVVKIAGKDNITIAGPEELEGPVEYFGSSSCAAQDVLEKFGLSPMASTGFIRIIRDNFVEPTICRLLLASGMLGMRRSISIGRRTSLRFPDPDTIAKIGLHAWLELVKIIRKTKTILEQDFSNTLKFKGGTISRLISELPEEDTLQINKDDSHWDIEISKTTSRTGFLATIFLNSHMDVNSNLGFSGGRVIFIDDDANRAVIPKQGRLLAMRVGSQNIHINEAVDKPPAGIPLIINEKTRYASFRIDLWFESKLSSVVSL